MFRTKYLFWSLLFAFVASLPVNIFGDDRPNILVIVADDLGYADLGFQGCKDIPTPHLDGLAKSGVTCTNGYVTHPFCSPTRAALLTGRYQQRFGHENNPAWLPEDRVAGLPLSETPLPSVLRTKGYATGCVGKWHLGAHPSFHPNRRGFEYYYGALGGGHIYLEGLKGNNEYTIPMNRNGEGEPLKGYITTVFGQEASEYIKKSQPKPWFLYLAFNAPHTPLQSTPELQQRVSHIESKERRDLAAMIVGMDDAVGEVLSTLDSTGQRENTLVFFFSDNGGPISVTKANNTPLRNGKGSVYEGGIRVPFVVSWPKKLPKDATFEKPVVSLDVFATSVSLSDESNLSSEKIDGVNLIPYLSGQTKESPHDSLFWRTGGGATFAARKGNWKLVGKRGEPAELYDLEKDISEQNNLAASEGERLKQLEQAYEEWNTKNVAPLFESPKQPRKKK
ncbi:MAG: sulfatase-like hydrolase/transferase [Planctomycetota bacterium]|nr:sulfatase-like hydrolase/transferase [Planctomycetota bacterium]